MLEAMNNGFEIEVMPLSVSSVRRKVEGFLAANGLRLDDVQTYIAVTCDDRIVAGGGLDGGVIKCVAVSEEARSEGITNALISRLISMSDTPAVKVFTKPENEPVFASLGFRVIARAEKAVLMENGIGGLAGYVRYLEGLRSPGRNGVIVMNANPFTKGHRYLVEQAAGQVDRLYIIVVKEDRSRFSYAERMAMVESGTSDLDNVTVCQGSDYVISAATFPTYFLKSLDDAAPAHIALDLDLFVRHIAPALGAEIRFAGSEPTDALTAQYNAAMARVLPENGIEFIEIQRLAADAVSCDTKAPEYAGTPVSASSVRRLLDNGRFHEAAALVPATTVPYLIAALVSRAMGMELDATPKPGLVDKSDSGSHGDMNYALMMRSIKTLRPYFAQFARTFDVDDVRRIGIEAEHAMLDATGGVNTHKGALFCMGLTTSAVGRLYAEEGKIEECSLRRAIMELAAGIPESKGTHGAEAKERYGAAGALEMARMGYPELFDVWLPFIRSHGHDNESLLRLLLLIMSSLDDTNVLHRAGLAGLENVKNGSAALLNDFSHGAMEQMNKDFIKQRISPGGSADMLALTMFITFITN